MPIDPVSRRWYSGAPGSLGIPRFAEASFQGSEARRRRDQRKRHWWNRKADQKDRETEIAGLEALRSMLVMVRDRLDDDL